MQDLLGNPVLRLVLAPLYLTQGAIVRRRAQVLPEAAGPRAGKSGAGRALRLLIIGDSSAAGVGVSRQDDALAGRLAAELTDFRLDWRLEATSGATTRSTLKTLKALQPAPFDAVVVVLGVNDVTRQVSLWHWQKRQTQLHAMLTEQFGPRRIYLCGVPPLERFPLLPQPLRAMLGARARAFDRKLARLAARAQGLRHLPLSETLLDTAMMATDGFHPGPQMYRLWAQHLAAVLREDFGIA